MVAPAKKLAMEYLKLTFVDEDENTHAHCFIDGNRDDGFLIQSFEGYRKSNDFTRRLCAAWNACEGLETELLEGLPLNFREHALQCSALREENARLRAAVAEMEGMLPVLEEIESTQPGFWALRMGESTTNAYRLAIETALANRSNP